MAVVALQRPYFLKILHKKDRVKIHGFGNISAANFSSSETRRKQESTIEISKASRLPQCEQIAINASSTLQFDRLQPEEEGLEPERIQEFGQFVAREAFLDEEFWTAAWLRAESHWEDKRNDRFVDSYKRKFAEQEFNALKGISRAKFGYNKQTCIVAVKKESRDVKRTVVKSVAGTLDLSIQYLSQGEAFPGVRIKTPLFCSKDRKSCLRYGYIANLCVFKDLHNLINLEYLQLELLSYSVSTATHSLGDIQYPFSLRSLRLKGWSKITSLPDQIQYLTILRDLYITDFEGLEALPEWLCNLKSLERLHFRSCKNLKQFPSAEALKSLTNLKHLEAIDCPLLKERYAEEGGPEWHTIAHIPIIIFESR